MHSSWEPPQILPLQVRTGKMHEVWFTVNLFALFLGPFTIEGGVGGTPAQSNATTSSPAVPPPAAVPSSSAVVPAPVPSSAPPSHSVSPPAPSASNAKVPASGSSPTGSSSANQLSATGARCMMAVAGAFILAYQLF
jgi:hypothetical protein